MPLIMGYAKRVLKEDFGVELPTWGDISNRLEQHYFQTPSLMEGMELQDYLESMKSIYSYTVQSISATFITINAQPDTELETLQLMMSDITKSFSRKNMSWITDCSYVYEQRGTNTADIGKGLHIHLLIRFNPSKYLSDVTKHIKYYIRKHGVISQRNLRNPAIFNVKSVKFLDEYERKQDYLSGHKVDSKSEKVKYDKLFRQQNNLSDIYSI